MNATINEKKAAVNMIESGIPIENLWEAKSILVKYYSKEKKESSSLDIKKSVMEITKKYKDFYFKDRDYNEYIDERSTEKAVGIYTKPMYKLSEEDSIKISKGELERIRKMDDECAEKLAFVLLVWCKLKNLKLTEFNSWIGDKTKDFYKYSKNRGGVVYQEKMIHRLYKAGLIDLPPIEEVDNMSLNIVMVEDEIRDEDVAIMVGEMDLEDVVFNYLKWRGETVIRCKECGVLVKSKSNNRKYCTKCSKEKQLEQQRKSMKKIRKTTDVK